MKAAVFYGPHDIRVENVNDPELEPDGIIIKVKTCGICGSDLHLYRNGERMPEGLILGHEFSGDVFEVGANVHSADIRKGDRVTATQQRPCGRCYWCIRGRPYRCSRMQILVYRFPGAFAEYVSIPMAIIDRTVFPLPDEMSYEEGATVEPLSVGEHAARMAEPRARDTVAILGAGMMGQCALQGFKAAGVSKIIVSEIGKKRLEVAKTAGADFVIDASQENPVERILEITSGRGSDIVIECAGVPTTFHQAIEAVRAGGKIVMVGVYQEALQWQPASVINRGIRLIGCFAGSFSRSLALLQSGKANTRPLLTHEFTLDNAREAFEAQLKADETVKVLIKP